MQFNQDKFEDLKFTLAYSFFVCGLTVFLAVAMWFFLCLFNFIFSLWF